MSRTPFFSVIVPTHKRPHLLRRALSSIVAQDFRNELEICVISDVADPESDAVCAELLGARDTYLKRSGTPGPSDSRNLGLSLINGRCVLFLDDDDAWHEGFLRGLYDSVEIAKGDAVYCDCSVVSERRIPPPAELLSETRLSMAGNLTEEVYVKNQVHMSCFAFPRELLSGLRFDPFMRAYEDWDFQLSVFDRMMPGHLPVLGSRVFEVHDDSTDRRGASQKATDFNAVLDYLYVYRRHPAPNEALRSKRAALLALCGMNVPAAML